MSGVPAEATPERLTAVLRRAGVLTRGEVVDVAVETSRDTLISRIARLRLTYAQGDDAGPSHVFFKTSREDAAEALRELGRKEVTFYDVVAVATPPGLLPRCYEAAAEPAGRSHRDLTIVHGDAHVWNALLPRDAGSDDVRLIDWDAWRVDTATDDLAYMIAVQWYPDWRRRYERESLRRYHDALVAGGVRGYSFDALWDDYRQSVLWQITTPMWQANHGLGPWIWWNHLERIMSAVHDLGCLELLD